MEGHTAFYNNVFQDLTPRSVDHYIDGASCSFAYSNLRPVDTRIYNFENFDLRGYQELFDHYDPFDSVILLNRDPYNWIASSMEKGGSLARLTETFVPGPNIIPGGLHYDKWFCQSMSRLDMWVQYMREVSHHNAMLKTHPGDRLLKRAVHTVNFNEWFAYKSIRENFCYTLGIPFTDLGIDKVARYGDGSSFSGLQLDGSAQTLDVLNRWKCYRDNPIYNSYLTEEIKKYSEDYFNFTPYE
jgi:hypothetical protein